MATARLIPSAHTLSSTYITTDDNYPASNAYTNTDSTTEARFTHNRSASSTYYVYLHNFNFNSIPSGATINSFSVKIKAAHNALSTSSSYRMSLYYKNGNSWTSITNTTLTSSLTTSATTYTFPTSGLSWSILSNYGTDFAIRIPLRRNATNTSGYAQIYGAEIIVDYDSTPISVTDVSLDKHSDSIEIDATTTLTATISPSNATNKSVTWTSSNTSVATVSNGVVTGISTGTTTITVRTTDGNFTDTCTITVTTPIYTEYVQTDTLVAGKDYIIVNGNSGQVYMVSNEANGSATLKGISTTITNGRISITGSVASKVLFTCDLEDSSNSDSTRLKNGSQYLYTDSSSGLRMFTLTSSADGKHWHYKADDKHLLWFFKDSNGDTGYTDTSSTYKYYLNCTSGNYTDAHVSTTSLADTTTPEIYLFTLPNESIYFKQGSTWTKATNVYKKINNAWVLQSNLSSAIDSNTNYIAGN